MTDINNNINLFSDIKKCRFCLLEKEKKLFTRNKSYKDGYATVCLECSKKYQSEKRKDINYVISERAKKFNTNFNVIDNLYKTYKVCQICGNIDYRRMLNIDHCHKTGKVRGLLCDSCNKALGLFKDNVESLNKAIEYLKNNY